MKRHHFTFKLRTQDRIKLPSKLSLAIRTMVALKRTILFCHRFFLLKLNKAISKTKNTKCESFVGSYCEYTLNYKSLYTINYILIGQLSCSTYIRAFHACLMIRHPRQVDRAHHRPPIPSNKYHNLSFIYMYLDI